MREECETFLIPPPIVPPLHSLALIASIPLASSVFLYPKLKEDLPDLLISIINKYLLFSTHYRHDSALATNLDVGS